MSKSKFHSDYICRVRYRNTLPALPHAPKMLTIPSLINRHVAYSSNNLVEKLPYPLIMDPGQTIPADQAIVDYLDAMETNPDDVNNAIAEVAEEDRILLTRPRDEQSKTSNGSSSLYTHKKPNVTWLRRSEYISAAHDTRSTPIRKEGVENKFAMSAAAAKKHSYNTRQAQIAGIENTFKRPEVENLRHPQTKAKAVKTTPLLPDMECWENIYTIGQFNTDPADEKRLQKRKAPEEEQSIEEQSNKRARWSERDATDRGILRPMVNPHDPEDTYLVWFLPDEDSTKRLVNQKEYPLDGLSEEPLTFHAVRDYEYQNDTGLNNKYLMIASHCDDLGEKATYSPIRSRMIVRKKRALSSRYKYLDDYEKPNILTVTYQKE
ncbi:RNA polymerase II-associated [Mycotypha africana]|uniref:RNA polymerase II-associated n=1 Tax=Mycotypha africana TaxID=64632 RepID=UPI0023018CCA|nr:RNA polymerase II-associated [Mycotypha africana]KAI8987646.1 RNA polymerase II-associated [Mycotypha africana]